jgi:hypothetical protein
MAWINSNWGLFRACCAAVGAASTVTGLRLRASRIGRRLRSRVETGELVWGAQVDVDLLAAVGAAPVNSRSTPLAN